MNRSLVLSVALVATGSCVKLPNDLVVGAVDVSVSTAGSDLDPDGYVATVAGILTESVGIDDDVTFGDIPAGDHSVELSGIASNCEPTGENPRIVTVAEGGVGQATFAISCAGPPGSIVVQTITGGSSLDPDGYTVTLDGTTARAVPTNGSTTFSDVPAGDHSVALSGIAGTCTLRGANSRTVPVPEGGVGQATFEISCGTGSIVVQTITDGSPLDPDGYTITLDGSTDQAVPTNGSITFSDVAPGRHTVVLSGEAPNCAVTGSSSQDVDVTAGVADSVDFYVTCSAPPAFDVIAYSSGPINDSEVMLVSTAGGTPISLTGPGARNGVPAVAPDGTRIFFESDRSGDLEIYVMDSDGSNLENLTNSPEADGRHAVSPDGLKLAFVSEREGIPEIYSMDIDGSNVQRLTEDSFYDNDPTWSSDGSRIAFRSKRVGGTYDIFVMNADGSSAVNITNNVDNDYDPVFSPDGTRIAFVSDREQPAGEIYTMDPDGSNVVRVTNNTASDSHPAWSWDSTQIAFASDRDGDLEIYVMDADGSNVVRLTTNPGRDDDPDWAPRR